MVKKRFKTASLILVMVLVLTTVFPIQAFAVSKQLDIPWRHQWLNDGGYCGELCIQSVALYYGTYISQYLVRDFAGGEVIAGADVDPPYGNASNVYDLLKLNWDRWNYNSSTPQYKKFLNWTKAKLNQGYPVIFGVYLADCSDEDFDHIIPAIGFSAASVSTYNNNDTITFYDNFTPPQSYTRTFGSFYDTRSMNGNGAVYDLCLPKNYDYGDVITGVEDYYDETYPVKLCVNCNDEPNPAESEPPVNMNATITISGLTSGHEYMLLRYGDTDDIPSYNFADSTDDADSVVIFTATGTTKTLTDTIMSDNLAVYRCVETED